MPRTGRGGSRQGTPGKQYANRADLQSAKLPVQTVPNQEYGLVGQQQAAQQTIPLSAPPTPQAAPPQGQPPQAQPGPPQGPLPGELGNFAGPTARPDEHMMTGAPTGPGPGPEVLSMNQPSGRITDMLSDLAKSSGNPDLQLLAMRAQRLGQ